MNERFCAHWLESYQHYTNDFEPPPIYHRWMGILTLAVAAGGRIWLQEANLKIWPNLYVVLVGPSGIGKGQSMREALPFIRAAYGKEWEYRISPDKITIPKLTQVLGQNAIEDKELGKYTPYLIWAEELPSFLGLDAYKSGKLADLTTLYDCADKWESGTKHQGDDKVAKPYICMGAGCTASGIFDVLPPQSVGQGFTSRLMYLYAHGYPKRVAEKPWIEDFHGKLKQYLINDIEVIAQMRGPVKLTDYARIVWNDYYVHRPLPPEEYGDERMQGYAARKPFYAKKIATLLSIAERPPKGEIEHPMVVEPRHINAAIALLEDVDKSMVEVYSEISGSTSIGSYGRIVRYLSNQPEFKAIRSQLRRKFAYQLDSIDFEKAVKSLEDMGIIEIVWEDTGYKGGKKQMYRLVKPKAAIESLAKEEIPHGRLRKNSDGLEGEEISPEVRPSHLDPDAEADHKEG